MVNVIESSSLAFSPSRLSGTSALEKTPELRDLQLILAAIERTREAYLILTPDQGGTAGRILYVNPAFCQMTGYTSVEVIGKSPEMLKAGVGEPAILETMQQSKRTDASFVRDVTCHRKDGSTFWAELQMVPVPDPERQGAHWVGIMRDISDRKHTEDSLLESQLRLSGILNSLSDVVWSRDIAQTKFIYLSPATERIFGRPVADFLHDPGLWFSMVHPDDADLVKSKFDEALQLGEFEIDYRIVRPDGEVRWLRNRVHVVRDRDGRVLYLDGIADDITAHHHAEKHVERMANFPHFNPNPIYELAQNGVLTYANEAATALALSLGATDATAILPKETQSIVAECLRTGQARLRLELPHGERTFSWSFFPILSTHVVHCYAGEITDRTRLEAQLRQSEKLKSVGQLAGGVAHDFNNILTIIHGFTNLLLIRADFDPEAIDHLQQISAAADRASDLTKQLLMFSRRQVLQPKVFDLNLVVKDLAKMLQRLLGEDVSLSVASYHRPTMIEADQGMIEQVIVNLAANSRDAMPRGGKLVFRTELVQLSAEDAGHHPDARAGAFVCMTSEDSGSGMDKTTIARIFEPFFTTKQPGKGTGLGLSTVYGIVRQHEGWVQVDSELGRGTSFHIFLPLAANAVVGSIQTKEKVKAKGGWETILVVEDEAPVLVLVRNILKSAGYKIIEAVHGLDALKKWSEHKDEIDLLLTDLVMPGTISGIDLAEQLFSEKESLKIIYTSGYSADVVGEKLAFDPGTNFLPKPYRPQQLLNLVRHILDEPAVK